MAPTGRKAGPVQGKAKEQRCWTTIMEIARQYFGQNLQMMRPKKNPTTRGCAAGQLECSRFATLAQG